MEEESDDNSFDAQWEAEAQAAHAKKRYKTDESSNDQSKKMSGDDEGDDVDGDVPPDIDNDTEDYEEECVICLEQLSDQEWGRCTPWKVCVNHSFHKKCWHEWENAHNKRVEQRRLRGESFRNEGVKCCLCNTVNRQFVDGTDSKPVHNPCPYVASEDNNNTNTGGNRFTNWFRDVGNEAGRFMDSLHGDTRSSTNRNFSRGGFPFGGTSSNPFAAPFFRNSNNTGSSYYNNSNGNPFNLLREGTQIVTQNLVNSPHLNNQQGIVIQYQPQSSRYLVQLQHTNIGSFIGGETAPVSVKPKNLLQTVKVKIHGLRSRTNFNGKEGTIRSYSRERNRYVVRVNFLLSDSREISIQTVNMRIPNGTVVRLEGLENASQWNGKYGTIVRFVDEVESGSSSGRYEVCLSRQYGVRVKPENVHL